MLICCLMMIGNGALADEAFVSEVDGLTVYAAEGWTFLTGKKIKQEQEIVDALLAPFPKEQKRSAELLALNETTGEQLVLTALKNQDKMPADLLIVLYKTVLPSAREAFIRNAEEEGILGGKPYGMIEWIEEGDERIHRYYTNDANKKGFSAEAVLVSDDPERMLAELFPETDE